MPNTPAASWRLRHGATPPRRQSAERLRPPDWPWDAAWWKPGDETDAGRIRELEKAGALALAERDRLVRRDEAETVAGAEMLELCYHCADEIDRLLGEG